jgi:hypothetical protein
MLALMPELTVTLAFDALAFEFVDGTGRSALSVSTPELELSALEHEAASRARGARTNRKRGRDFARAFGAHGVRRSLPVRRSA